MADKLKKEAPRQDDARPSRRKFLTGAAAATGAAVAAFPLFAQEKKGDAKDAPKAAPAAPAVAAAAPVRNLRRVACGLSCWFMEIPPSWNGVSL